MQVIKQGAFLDNEATKKSSSLSAEELLELLDVEKSFQDKAQSGVVSDQVGPQKEMLAIPWLKCHTWGSLQRST